MEFDEAKKATPTRKQSLNYVTYDIVMERLMTPHSKFLSHFDDFSKIYEMELSPTTIHLVTEKTTGQKMIIKEINKDMMITEALKQQARIEGPLHCSFDHLNIVAAYEFSESEKSHLLLMEYLKESDYFKLKIEQNLNPIKSELKMKSYIKDCLEGLAYIHSMGIVHSDIKLENLFIERISEDKIPLVKISDFGLSHFIDPMTKTTTLPLVCGTNGYLAPEIKGEKNIKVTEKIDMWALGIVLYKMAVAYRPTQIAGYTYGSGPIPYRRIDWRKKTKQLQDFISRLLEYDPNKRPSAEEALTHEWFSVESTDV